MHKIIGVPAGKVELWPLVVLVVLDLEGILGINLVLQLLVEISKVENVDEEFDDGGEDNEALDLFLEVDLVELKAGRSDICDDIVNQG